MTTDPVEQFLDAYLDHLETGADEPTLDSLDDADRARAQELIDMMRAARGIDARLSRPSLDAMLSGTEFEDWLDEHAPDEPDMFEIVLAEVVSALGLDAAPRRDVEALQDSLRSDAVLVYRGARLRLQFRPDLDASQLAAPDPQSVAGPIFGRFPETAGVILVANDVDLSSVAISPFDADSYLGTPDGVLHIPEITRPILPLRDSLKLYLDEVSPDLSAGDRPAATTPIDPAEVVRSEVRAAIDAIVSEGRKARTPAKRDAFNAMHSATEDLTALVTRVVRGDVDPDDLRAEIDRLAPFAA